MRFVDFEYNMVKHVGEGLLDNLTNLIQVEMNDNICVNQRAYNSSQITQLKETLRTNCTDIAQETTTQSTTISTTSNQPPRCEIDDIEDFVCGLDEEIKFLKGKDEKLQTEVDNLNEKNSFLIAENQEIRAILLELEQMLIDLTITPCAC